MPASKPPIPLDESEFLCGSEGCTNPFPCPDHQAFEAAACAPPLMMCHSGSSDRPMMGCTTPTECRARGACAKPLPSLPAGWAADHCAAGPICVLCQAPMIQPHRCPNAPAEIHDNITLRLPGRLERPPLITPAPPAIKVEATRPEAPQKDEDGTPTRPLPRLSRLPPPDSMHGADIMPPAPPPICPKCGSAMVQGSEFSADLCINGTCF